MGSSAAFIATLWVVGAAIVTHRAMTGPILNGLHPTRAFLLSLAWPLAVMFYLFVWLLVEVL